MYKWSFFILMSFTCAAFANKSIHYAQNDLNTLRKTGKCISCSLSGADINCQPNLVLDGSIINNISISYYNDDCASASFVNTTSIKANFREVNLTNANFSNANLTNANFGYAELSGANFTGAILTDANFRGANLLNAMITPDQLKTVTHCKAIMPNGELSDDC